MNLTRHTDYALRVLMYLASTPERLATIAEIAGAYEISRNHLMKVVHELGRAGFVHTVRGQGGGLRLGMPAERINVGAVVRTMEENLEIIDCSKPGCPILGACGLRGMLDDALEAFLQVLDAYTLEDLVGERRRKVFAGLLRIEDRVSVAR